MISLRRLHQRPQLPTSSTVGSIWPRGGSIGLGKVRFGRDDLSLGGQGSFPLTCRTPPWFPTASLRWTELGGDPRSHPARRRSTRPPHCLSPLEFTTTGGGESFRSGWESFAPPWVEGAWRRSRVSGGDQSRATVDCARRRRRRSRKGCLRPRPRGLSTPPPLLSSRRSMESTVSRLSGGDGRFDVGRSLGEGKWAIGKVDCNGICNDVRVGSYPRW